MKPATLAGVLLIVVGLVALAYQGISYTTRETVLEIGPIKATAERERTIVSPIVGGVAVLAGIALVVTGRKGR